MRGLICSILCFFLLAAPASAELRELRAWHVATESFLWLGFDAQPGRVVVEPTVGGARLVAEGVDVAARTIAPASTDLVTSVRLEPGAQGATIVLQAAAPWQSVEAERRQGGVLVTVRQAEPVPVPVSPVPTPAVRRDPSPPDADGTATPPATSAAAGEDFASRPTPPAPETGAEAPPAEPQPSPDAAAPADSTPAPSDTAAPAGCTEAARAAEADPWDEERLHAHAVCLTGEGALAAAAQIYEQMLAFEPENYRAIVALADIREAQGDAAAAIELYDRAALHAMSDSEATRARARLRQLRGQ